MTISFWQDFKLKELLPVKLLLFLQASGDAALYPFLTLHMKYLGISVADIGLQFALSPVATLIATPLVGLLADKIGNFKIMLSVSIIICAALSQLFLLVPAVKKIYIEDPYLVNNTIFYCQPELGLAPFHVQFNKSFSLKECHGYCEPEGASEPTLCLLHGTDEYCGLPDMRFDVKFRNETSNPSNNSNSVNIVYNNITYNSVVCKIPHNSSLCGVKCEIAENRSGLFIIDPTSKAITFWAYLVIRIGLFVIIATEMSLLKAAILTLLDKHDSDYGFQRLWSSVAVCVVPPVTGVIMDKLKNGEVEDYRPCFYIYGGMKLVMAVTTLILDLSMKTPTLHVWRNLGKLLKNPEADTLLIYCIFIGSCWGYLETFFLWFMEGLGASKSLMGLTFTVGALFGIPVTLVAGFLARKFGHVTLITLGLFVYCGRFIGYSYIESPYEALGLEALECITMGLMIITITTYSNVLAGKELVATMQATWAALHFSIGKALGSMAGGYMMEAIGTRTTYRVFAGMSAIMGVLYSIIYFIWFRKNNIIPEAYSQNAANSDMMKSSSADDGTVKKISLEILDAASEKGKEKDLKNDRLQENNISTTNKHNWPENHGFRLRPQNETKKKLSGGKEILGEENLGCDITRL